MPACVCLLVGAAVARPAGHDQATLQDLVDAAGRYVREYEQSFSAVVSREHYVQLARAAGVQETRQIRSEVALVAVGRADWLVFRDIYEVDGRAIPDRGDRLAELFMKPRPDLGAQARRIAEEGARFNLGGITRTVNTPTQALAFVRPDNQLRSTFRLGGRARIEGVETRELQFEETAMPRLILTPDDAPAAGSVWVVPASGVVVRTELRIESAGASAVIAVTYVRDDRLSLWVPARMTEFYEQTGSTTASDAFVDRGLGSFRSRSTIEGRATYSDFRRFTVNTSAIIR